MESFLEAKMESFLEAKMDLKNNSIFFKNPNLKKRNKKIPKILTDTTTKKFQRSVDLLIC
jgi:hypothetical protein